MRSSSPAHLTAPGTDAACVGWFFTECVITLGGTKMQVMKTLSSTAAVALVAAVCALPASAQTTTNDNGAGCSGSNANAAACSNNQTNSGSNVSPNGTGTDANGQSNPGGATSGVPADSSTT